MDETALPASRRARRDSLSERLRLAIDRLTDPDIEVVQASSIERLADPPKEELAQAEPTNPISKEA